MAKGRGTAGAGRSRQAPGVTKVFAGAPSPRRTGVAALTAAATSRNGVAAQPGDVEEHEVYERIIVERLALPPLANLDGDDLETPQVLLWGRARR